MVFNNKVKAIVLSLSLAMNLSGCIFDEHPKPNLTLGRDGKVIQEYDFMEGLLSEIDRISEKYSENENFDFKLSEESCAEIKNKLGPTIERISEICEEFSSDEDYELCNTALNICKNTISSAAPCIQYNYKFDNIDVHFDEGLAAQKVSEIYSIASEENYVNSGWIFSYPNDKEGAASVDIFSHNDSHVALIYNSSVELVGIVDMDSSDIFLFC